MTSVAAERPMIFVGKIDESEISRIKEKLPIEITSGAILNKKLDAILQYIVPKIKTENGAIQFEIKTSLNNSD